MERIEFYIKHRNQREQQILKTMETQSGHPWRPMELVKIIYVDTPENLHLAAEKNVKHHLSKLLKEGKVKSENDNTYTL